METIKSDALMPGDVLLEQGTELFSRLIMLFDGGPYSHAALFNGKQVVEAIESGVGEGPLLKRIEGSSLVDVYRFRSNDGLILGDNLSAKPIILTATKYVKSGEQYAYERLLLLAGVITTRRIPVPMSAGVAMIIRNIIDSASERVSNLLSLGRKPMVCSEFVYRCFAESGERYFINVVGADVTASVASAHEHDRIDSPSTSTSEFDRSTLANLKISAATLLARYQAAGLLPGAAASAASPVRRNSHASNAPTAVVAAVPAFVTPGDLQRSPNMVLVGRLSR